VVRALALHVSMDAGTTSTTTGSVEHGHGDLSSFDPHAGH